MKKIISAVVICLLIPAIVIGGAFLFPSKAQIWIAVCVALLACVPFLLTFEKRETDTNRLILIAAMTALSVAGRVIFAPVQGFKPVTALVVITAMYFGGEAGFMTGALSALISNFYFGQGPWTPFQMFGWGALGFIAGLIAKPLKRSRVLLTVYGIISGAAYSLFMDVLTVIWMDGFFNFTRYIAALVSSLPFTAVYAVSNVVFLLLLAKPVGKIAERMKTKYGL